VSHPFQLFLIHFVQVQVQVQKTPPSAINVMVCLLLLLISHEERFIIRRYTTKTAVSIVLFLSDIVLEYDG